MTRWLPVTVEPSSAPSSRPEGDSVARDDDDAEITFAASTESEDRSGDVVLASGWELDAFRKNPVFLWAHRHDRPPIGRVARVWVDGGSLMATVRFAPTPFAQEVAALYRQRYLSGVSVGFRALQTESRKAASGRAATLFVRQELLEISAAPVPMNAEALAKGGVVAEASVEYQVVAGGGGNGLTMHPQQDMELLAGVGRIWQALAEVV